MNTDNNKTDNNKNTTTHNHPPCVQRDFLRQDMEMALAALISDFEAEHHIAIHAIDVERDDRDERGQWTKLKRFPLTEDPHPPVARVRIGFAEGPLVSATARVVEPEQDEPGDLTEPPESIEEAALRLANEAHQDGEYEDSPMTRHEEYLYGGRYA